MEFARNVPKPKVKPQQEGARKLSSNDDLQGIEEEPFDENGNTLKGEDLKSMHVTDDLETLNRKHSEYADEIAAIKALIGE